MGRTVSAQARASSRAHRPLRPPLGAALVELLEVLGASSRALVRLQPSPIAPSIRSGTPASGTPLGGAAAADEPGGQLGDPRRKGLADLGVGAFRLGAQYPGEVAVAVGDLEAAQRVEADHVREVDRIGDAVRGRRTGRPPGRTSSARRRAPRSLRRRARSRARLRPACSPRVLVRGVLDGYGKVVAHHPQSMEREGVSVRAALPAGVALDRVGHRVHSSRRSDRRRERLGRGRVEDREAREERSPRSAASICCSGSLITAPKETSEPVPAVVGMHANGATGSGAPRPSSSRGRV